MICGVEQMRVSCDELFFTVGFEPTTWLSKQRSLGLVDMITLLLTMSSLTSNEKLKMKAGHSRKRFRRSTRSCYRCTDKTLSFRSILR